MSRDNAERFHETVDAYNRGDIEAVVATAHPDVEWHPFTAEAEGGGPFRGHDGVRRWWSNLHDQLDALETSVDECRDLGEAVIAFGRLRLRSKSGVTLDQEIAWVARYRDGLWVWGRTFRSRAEALEAVGLSE